jgi:hypothetical protein
MSNRSAAVGNFASDAEVGFVITDDPALSDRIDIERAFDQNEVGDVVVSAGDPNARVDAIEDLMRSRLPQIDIEPVHWFADGIYAREITILAGTLLTGKMHRTQHLNIISKGSITVWSAEHGAKRIDAPCTFVASPGTRRVGFAHEDTVWTTVHATTETDLDKLEVELIEPRVRRIGGDK